MSDELFNGDRIRLFTLVDNFIRESPAIEVARSIPARRVIEVLDRVVVNRGLPKIIRVDNVLIAESRAFVGKTHPWGELQSVRSLVILCGLLGYPAMPALCMEVPLTIVTGVLFRPDVT